ncbi:MAG: cytochrome C [Candidatus Hydrogenedentes bacterium]|nr:cytochrome C [Candidatus Hydrogenedentota bacterium]
MVSRLISIVASFLWFLGRNTVTILGATVTTISAITIFVLFSLELSGILMSPYLGIITFVVMPAGFIFGLILILLGTLWQHRRDQKLGKEARPTGDVPLPKLDFNSPKTRQVAGMVLFLSLANLFIVGATSYQSVVYMDSAEFCGKVCHTVMEPESVAHAASPHGRVECVACHIGPGAPWFVKSKLSGVGQLFAVTFNTYEHPIPTPVENLRPSRDTCEQCHWPAKFTGDRLRVIKKYGDDDANSPTYTALLMHIGGGSNQNHGIHSWHIDPRRETTYVSVDRQRQEIALVRVKEPDGSISEFKMQGTEYTPEQLAQGETRIMDCIDCHNRPTHVFDLPGPAMDKALTQGLIDATLPGIKRVGVEALQAAKGEDKAADLDGISQKLETHFRETFADTYDANADRVKKAIDEVQGIYKRNVFPAMDVTWGTYINNIGHTDFPGCFRCHDGNHTTDDGRTISQDCTLCHGVLAMEEENPQVLSDLGIQ